MRARPAVWFRAASCAAALVVAFGAGVATGRTTDRDTDRATDQRPLVAADAVAAVAAGDAVEIHPPFADRYVCVEHPDGQLSALGDALGSDCFIVTFADPAARQLPRLYRNDGAANEDWIGWRKPVLAPFAATVEAASANERANTPGILGEGRSGRLVFRRDDGVRVVFAHLQDITVEAGQRVAAGQQVAVVGNNGQSWFPHLHIGAWADGAPLQVRTDLVALGRALGHSGGNR